MYMNKFKGIIPAITINSKTYQIFQIITGRDGSIYITFPYYKYSKGLVSLVRIPKNSKFPRNISLIDYGSRGKVTSHLVKVSHHLSGQANFSLTGKIFTILKKSSIELSKDSGHLFTVQFQGLKDFKELTTLKKNYLYRKFIVKDKKYEAFKIVGFWYSKSEFKNRLNDIDYEKLIKHNYDAIKFKSKMGHKGTMFIIRSDIEATKDYWLCLYCVPLEKIDKNNYSTLTFLGGFDKREIANNLNLDTHFIGMIYPAKSYEELKEKIGSIDIIENL